MASTQKIPSGRFRGIYRDASGHRRYTQATARKQDAREAAVDAEAKARRQAAATDGSMSARTTWGDWWAARFEGREYNSDYGTTVAYIVRKYLAPRWGAVPLNRIVQADVQAWVDELARERAPAYVQSIVSPFRVSITDAVRRGVLTASPCAGLALPKRQVKAKDYMSTDYTESLADKLDERYADAINFALEVGLRPGELAALHARSVDLEQRWLTVSDAYIHRKKLVRATPKDREARGIPLSEKAVEIARRRLADRDLRAGCGLTHLDGRTCRSVLVFLPPLGSVMNCDLLNQALKKAASLADAERKSSYTMRRGFATRLAEAGLDAFALADLMGHSDIHQTREYVQRSPQARARFLSALGEPQPLREVSDVIHDHERDTARETDRDNQGFPEGVKRNHREAR